DVEAAPGRIDEVHRAPRRDDPVGAGRPGRVQAHRPHRVARDPGQAEHVCERPGERLDRHRRALGDPAGRLDQPVHQELPGGIQHRRVDGPPAVVEADNGLLALTWHPRLPRPAERTAAPARRGPVRIGEARPGFQRFDYMFEYRHGTGEDMLAAVAAGASHPAVAALLGLGAVALAGLVVAMAWDVNARQIRLGEQLARRQFIVTGETGTANGAANGAVAGVRGHGTALQEEAAAGAVAAPPVAIDGPETVVTGEQARYRL